MSRTVIGAFQDMERAREAVRQLEAKDFGEREVSLLGPHDRQAQGGRQDDQNRSSMRQDSMHQDNQNRGGMRQDSLSDGATWGAGIGGAAGILAAVGAIAIPGIGPLVAAGPLAAALTGAAAGGVTGAFMDMGIPAASGKRYEEELKRGHSVVTVQTDDQRMQTARNVLEAQGAHDIEID